MQNKLLWAISEQTAAELVYRRVDATLPLLGMQSYDKKNLTFVRKSDVSVAKNYLTEDEIRLQKAIEKEESLKEIEEDIKRLKKPGQS